MARGRDDEALKLKHSGLNAKTRSAPICGVNVSAFLAVRQPFWQGSLGMGEPPEQRFQASAARKRGCQHACRKGPTKEVWLANQRPYDRSRRYTWPSNCRSTQIRSCAPGLVEGGVNRRSWTISRTIGANARVVRRSEPQRRRLPRFSSGVTDGNGPPLPPLRTSV